MTGPSTDPVFVPFPHPGTEHNPGKVQRQPWNRWEHRRKFLLGNGRSVDGEGPPREAALVFWGGVGGAVLRY
jgi:hypothetical protein